MKAWTADVEALGSDLADWQLDGVWSVVRAQGRAVGHPTRTFVDRWIAILKQGESLAVVCDNSLARALVRERESQLKRGRARLASPRHLELWGGRSGTGRMNYRWGEGPMAGTRMILRTSLTDWNGARAMLGTRERRLLLESLRPPAGYRLRRAVGTSYTLDLIALLTGSSRLHLFRCARRGRRAGDRSVGAT